MRKKEKIFILEMISTLYDAHTNIEKLVGYKEFALMNSLLCDCQETAISIGNTIENTVGEDCATIGLIEAYCESLFEVSQSDINESSVSKCIKYLDKQLRKVENGIKYEIKEKYEIVFMPYKAAMWDCLESIWVHFVADNECETSVVPIPYYDRTANGELGELQYDIKLFPQYVPVTDYREYDIERIKPDIVFIHNPYDGSNYVTCVEPRFFSEELKKYTKNLVYVPYFVTGYYAKKESAIRNIPLCIDNVDYCIVQNEVQRKAFSVDIETGKKLLVMGSPKFDRIINELGSTSVPEKLKDKIYNKKTILFNSSISTLLKNNEWRKDVNDILDIFESDVELFLIWRPHPLLLKTVKAMRPDMVEDIISIINRIERMDNAIIDSYASADISMSVSDGMISDYSSLVLQYTATGKPVLLTVGKSEYRYKKLVCCDYFSNYFMEDGISVEKFCFIIKNDCDALREERIKRFSESIVNADGTSGRKIYDYFSKLIKG